MARLASRLTLLLALACPAVLPGAALAQSAPPETADPAAHRQLLERIMPSMVKVYGAGGFTGIPAYGSGVFVSANGHVLTAWSIALDTETLRVVTDKGHRYDAEIWRANPNLGVALVKIRKPNESFPALRLGDSTKLRPGDSVLGLGNPFGFLYGDEKLAVMRGVITAVEPQRREGVDVLRLPAGLKNVLLTDIPNNPGTQGGALITPQGELVGILGRLVESRATNTVLNFAVPTAEIREFVRAGLNATRAEPRPAVGLGRPPRGEPAESGIRLLEAHLVRSPMAYVERVVKGSPAEQAGIKPDDLVFRLDGRTIRSCRDFHDALRSRSPGDTIKLVLKRGQRMVTAELTLVQP